MIQNTRSSLKGPSKPSFILEAPQILSPLSAMAEAESTSPTPLWLEVKCKCSGKTRRFAVGTEAGFAVSVINRKLAMGSPSALHIEALKDGEEPIAFGPNSLLVNYGDGWNLETVTDLDFSGVEHAEDFYHDRTATKRAPFVDGPPQQSKIANEDRKPTISLVYIGKIIFAFVLLFVLGAIFTLALENLPLLISFSQHAFK